MRILFMGTPDFAVPSLARIQEAGFPLCGVFCQPDRPKGRGHRLQMPPVKEMAVSLGIPVFQPDSLRDQAVLSEIAALNPDCIVVVAYGKLLPKAVLDIPKYGCINVHGSLLPRYRGAAPIQWAVIDGAEKTGVTTMYMAEGMDTGDMILQRETEILPDETAGELFDRLKLIGADLLIETLLLVSEGRAPRIPQEDVLASMAPILKKRDGAIDWTKPAQQIYRLIRGMNPWPSAYTEYQGKKLKIYKSRVVDRSGAPGTLLSEGGRLLVCCGTKALQLLELQPENGKRMDGGSFLRGHPIKPGSRFTQPENG